MTASVALPLLMLKGQQSYSLSLRHHQCKCQHRKRKRMSYDYFESIFDLMDPLKALSRPSFMWTTLCELLSCTFEKKWQDRSPLGVGKFPAE